MIRAPKEVRVLNFRAISSNLGVISYLNEKNEHVDDLYNINDPKAFDTLCYVPVGRQVFATLTPDGADEDKHPEVASARMI